MKSKQIYVLKYDTQHFNNKIPAGSVYKKNPKNGDEYECFIDRENIIMKCPSFNLHWMIVENNSLFIKSFEVGEASDERD